MGVTAQSLTGYFPEFSTETPQRISLFAAEAGNFINASVYGAKANFALHCMTAHLITMANRRGVSGIVTGETVGPISTTYSGATGTADPTDLDETSYGRMLKGMKRSVLRTPITP